MRYVDLNKLIKTREQLSLRISLLYSGLTGIVLFIFIVFSGDFFAGLLTGAIVFGFLFFLIFGLRKLTHKGIERKRSKITFDELYFDVLLKGEVGALSIYNDGLRYYNLTPGGSNKDFDIPITEDLFISINDFKYGKFKALKYGDLKQVIITLKEMPNGLPRQFVFYDIEGLKEMVVKRLDEVNIFNLEKYQKN